MYCNQCGNIIPENSMFCTFCGARNTTEAENTADNATSAQIPEQPAVTEQRPAYTNPIYPNPPAPAMEYPTGAMAPNFSAQVPQQKTKKEKPEKYYTFGHLMLCLAAVGVMAIVAGVFAGLYFSVI
ncbi:MAG: zinc-ribbon domain-containing protein [Oscillospiraceae bacterium]|nr:zinc-ribbon domain-containing protein [Oscillospiraceae bacterium]